MALLYTRSYALSSPFIVGQVHDLPVLHLRVCEYRVEQVSCPHCQQVSQWGFPAEVNAPVQYGPNVRVLEVNLHHYRLLAMEYTCEAMADMRSKVTVYSLD